MEIQLLQDILDEYERGTLDMTEMARKCYLSEKEKVMNRVTWIHNDELKNHLLLRTMSGNNTRDFLKNRTML